MWCFFFVSVYPCTINALINFFGEDPAQVCVVVPQAFFRLGACYNILTAREPHLHGHACVQFMLFESGEIYRGNSMIDDPV